MLAKTISIPATSMGQKAAKVKAKFKAKSKANAKFKVKANAIIKLVKICCNITSPASAVTSASRSKRKDMEMVLFRRKKHKEYHLISLIPNRPPFHAFFRME